MAVLGWYSHSAGRRRSPGRHRMFESVLWSGRERLHSQHPILRLRALRVGRRKQIPHWACGSRAGVRGGGATRWSACTPRRPGIQLGDGRVCKLSRSEDPHRVGTTSALWCHQATPQPTPKSSTHTEWTGFSRGDPRCWQSGWFPRSVGSWGSPCGTREQCYHKHSTANSQV